MRYIVKHTFEKIRGQDFGKIKMIIAQLATKGINEIDNYKFGILSIYLNYYKLCSWTIGKHEYKIVYRIME